MTRTDVEQHFRAETRPVAVVHAWRIFLRRLLEAGHITEAQAEQWREPPR